MGTARTSPKLVRERRAKGIAPNRGKVRRHFPKTHRNDRHLENAARAGKAWAAVADPLQAIADRLLSSVSPVSTVHDDVAQDIWVRLLEGQSEDQIRSDLRPIIRAEQDIAFGPWRALSLDQEMYDRQGNKYGALSNLLDTNGVLHRRRTPTPKRFDPTRRARREALVEWYRSYLTAQGRPQVAFSLRSALSAQIRIGRLHSEQTKQRMSDTRRRLWAGDYGQRRRHELAVERKICRRCGYAGPWANFAKNPKCYGGRDKICKPCMSVQTQEYKRRKRAQIAIAA